MNLKRPDFIARALTAAYLAKRLILGGEARRFAPAALPVFDPDAPAEQGVVDSVVDGTIRGWCRSLDYPDSATRVDIYVDGAFVARTVCNIYREDLRANRLGAGRHGFAVELSADVLAVGKVLRVIATNSGLELRGSPFHLRITTVELETAPEAYRRAVLQLCQEIAPHGGAVSLQVQRSAYGQRLEVLGGCDTAFSDSGWPVTRAMSYFNARFHRGTKPVHGDQAYFQLLLMAADHFSPATAGLPIGAAQYEALSASAGWLIVGRVRTSALLDLYMRANDLGPTRDEDQAARVLVGFCYDVLVRKRMPVELLGESAAQFLAASVDSRGWTRCQRACAGLPMLKGLGLRGKEERLAAAAVVGKALGLTFVTGRFAAPTIKACNEPVPPGVAIISSGEGAISTNARHSAAALDQLGIAHRLISVSIWKGDSETRKGRLSEASAEVILLHVQPDDAVELIVRLPPKAVGSRLIGFFMWETESLPAAHQLGAMLVDEIWTGSHYSAKAFQTSAPSVAAHVVGHAVQDMPPAIDFDARQWAGVSRDTFLFYTHFDARSWITRKNPVGAVRAFCRAFPSSASAAALLIKVRIPEHWADPEQEPWWKELYEEASRDSRIRVISADLDPGQMSALALAADAFVSLHRSEGFGYAVAEAMLAGKPVVVTDYSGSQDFAGQAEALLVPARRRPVRFGEFLYGDPGQVWSEPDIEAAALAMRALSEDRAIGADLARNGQTRIREQCSIERLSLRYAERLGCGSS